MYWPTQGELKKDNRLPILTHHVQVFNKHIEK